MNLTLYHVSRRPFVSRVPEYFCGVQTSAMTTTKGRCSVRAVSAGGCIIFARVTAQGRERVRKRIRMRSMTMSGELDGDEERVGGAATISAPWGGSARNNPMRLGSTRYSGLPVLSGEIFRCLQAEKRGRNAASRESARKCHQSQPAAGEKETLDALRLLCFDYKSLHFGHFSPTNHRGSGERMKRPAGWRPQRRRRMANKQAASNGLAMQCNPAGSQKYISVTQIADHEIDESLFAFPCFGPL